MGVDSKLHSRAAIEANEFQSWNRRTQVRLANAARRNKTRMSTVLAPIPHSDDTYARRCSQQSKSQIRKNQITRNRSWGSSICRQHHLLLYRTIDAFKKAVDEGGVRYGLKLNKHKCELITTHPSANLFCGDNTKVPKVRLATCPGCSAYLQTAEKNCQTVADTTMAMKRLDLFWRYSNCDIAIKFHTADPMRRWGPLCGSKAAQPIPAAARRLDIFQLRVFRKRSRPDTPHINRASANRSLFNTANQQMREGCEKTVTPHWFIKASACY